MDSRRLNETCTLSILSCIKGREVAMAWDSNNNRQLKFPKGASSLFVRTHFIRILKIRLFQEQAEVPIRLPFKIRTIQKDLIRHKIAIILHKHYNNSSLSMF